MAFHRVLADHHLGGDFPGWTVRGRAERAFPFAAAQGFHAYGMDEIVSATSFSRNPCQGEPRPAGGRTCGYVMRVRSGYINASSGDTVNATTYGSWKYFTFTK
ncbi:hypothetical protein Psi02_08140 [Planotetraspora silvatica]|uniref:Uncharacterized protein n=1 Tax=Planotetraspora silvatica TaxID=234614 RepID=A0A8J3XKM2_9ACTN|nr:hypothetical protein Psi02_08140 [Planotetraspora silvatica]